MHVTKENTTFPYFAVFDFEAMLVKLDDTTRGKLKYTHQHVPVSVSINSNVPGFDSPKHFVNANLDHLLELMLEYLQNISDKACNLTREKLQSAFSALQQKLSEIPAAATFAQQPDPTAGDNAGEIVGFDNDSDNEIDDIEELDESFIDNDEFDEETPENPYLHAHTSPTAAATAAPRENNDPHKFIRKTMLSLRQALDEYCQQLPVLGFNSAKYDLNLIKAKLAKHLRLDQKNGFVIKRSQSYTCISTTHYKFLDITSYLAAGASYAKFLKAYGVREEKGFFPYEWFDSIEKLNCTTLPPFDAFYSELKGCNTLEADGKGAENYAYLQELWEQKQMQSFRDFLEYYNNADVIGFVRAVEKMLEFYFSTGIDLFKTTISLPNLARSELFKCTDALFPVFDYLNQDIYRTIQQNIVGGPSIIFKREAKAGESSIRNNPSVIGQRIMGHDANGLYAYCIAQPMPTGCYVDRREENGFKPEICHRHMDMYFWMDYVADLDRITIKHKLNNDQKEVRIGPYFVDGYCAETRTVYEFHGCWFHFCAECQTMSENPKTRERQIKARQRTAFTAVGKSNQTYCEFFQNV